MTWNVLRVHSEFNISCKVLKSVLCSSSLRNIHPVRGRKANMWRWKGQGLPTNVWSGKSALSAVFVAPPWGILHPNLCEQKIQLFLWNRRIHSQLIGAGLLSLFDRLIWISKLQGCEITTQSPTLQLSGRVTALPGIAGAVEFALTIVFNICSPLRVCCSLCLLTAVLWNRTDLPSPKAS